ncbi:hypothetical protein [Stenomitos frigidus]|uniref:Uncharacterized protein n=1 Tax=Stenomitos frigidus ULC18 TaxID=2107698 RepID=A0A2T1EFR7_9CYAN|nr:hypothetical protein [Stenomitos frigidus]PSB31597.1 hypothetical protein C7B82_07170 [Stenomitos frigidus ULC18]
MLIGDEPQKKLSVGGRILSWHDRLVMQAYGFSDSDAILEKLLTLNLELSEKEKQDESVISPWAPQER